MENKVMSFVKENTWLTIGSHGWGNGYVVVFEGHPAYKEDYNSINANVHGGLTFSDYANQLDWPEITEDMKDGWIIGFDTCHYGDTMRKWPKERVIEETDDLKNQMLNLVVEKNK